jgi:hypothetical protein
MPGNSYKEWSQRISRSAGGLLEGLLEGLIELADSTLVQYRLLSERYDSGGTSNKPKPLIDPSNLGLTDLGFKFCENIRSWRASITRR